MTPKEVVKRSKHLSLVLRHQPESVGLTLDEHGWVGVSDLLKAIPMTLAELEQVVAENNKKRFEFNQDKTQIRASQGHSVSVDLGYEEKVPPEVLYHGTSRNFLLSIKTVGLSKMQRHHVHMSADQDTALTVARRRTGPLVLTVMAGEMHRQGHKFYLSTNGVWLTDKVPAQFLQGL